MNRTEHLLCILAEEATEVGQRVSKALRFGVTEIMAGQEHTNAERIMHEYADLVAAIDMLEADGIIRWPADWSKLVDAKRAKVERFLEYSKECGTFDAPPKGKGRLIEDGGR